MVGHGLRARARLAALAASAALVSFACSESALTLDPARTEAAIARAVEGQVTVEVIAVECPEVIERGEGNTFDCGATVEAGELRLAVTQKADDGLDVEVLDTVLDRAEVAAEVEEDLADTFGRAFDAECGSEGATIVSVGEKLVCQASDAHGSRSVTVTVVNGSGGLSIEVR